MSSCVNDPSPQVTLPAQQQQQQIAKSGNQRGGASSGSPQPEPDNAVAEVLENTLWNRQLGVMSEEIVAALVCQIFEGEGCCPDDAVFVTGSAFFL